MLNFFAKSRFGRNSLNRAFDQKLNFTSGIRPGESLLDIKLLRVNPVWLICSRFIIFSSSPLVLKFVFHLTGVILISSNSVIWCMYMNQGHYPKQNVMLLYCEVMRSNLYNNIITSIVLRIIQFQQIEFVRYYKSFENNKLIH